MRKTVLGTCPVCNQPLRVTRLECSKCGTSIGGNFEVCKFCQLDTENRIFIETFIKCRGSIKEVERELGISYPTVRSRLERVIKALGYEVEEDKPEPIDKMSVLEALENQEIDVEEAIRRLKGE